MRPKIDVSQMLVRYTLLADYSAQIVDSTCGRGFSYA